MSEAGKLRLICLCGVVLGWAEAQFWGTNNSLLGLLIAVGTSFLIQVFINLLKPSGFFTYHKV